jgi:O-antigen ligase
LDQYPTAARELASGDALFNVSKYHQANIGGYDFIYALVMVAPVMLWMIRRTAGFMRLVNIFALVAAITCVIKSQYTIALITLALSIAIALIRRNKAMGFVLTAGVLLFLLTGGLNQLGEFVRWLSTKVEYDYVSDRLLQVAQVLQGQVISTDTSSRRMDIYFHAIDLFRQKPIFGWNLFSFSKENVSGHTLILDLLSGGGILGLILYVLPIRSLCKKALHNIQKPASDMIKVTWIVFIMVACLNPVVYSLILTIPFTALMCVNETERLQAEQRR